MTQNNTDNDDTGTRTVFVVVNSSGENSGWLTHETVSGVYKSSGPATLAAKEFGEYAFVEDLDDGDPLPDALIYETTLHTTQVDSLNLPTRD